ncbi:calmodulin-like [Coccinella septempunctata]|uniref:calmodulin-like n=1 Tax=Coccinella septempunctata TaxID=41139 RepID=UPI001D092A10|nr:calmodulin-like [Coccinella septempunctata]
MSNSNESSSLDQDENPLINEDDMEEFYEAFSNFSTREGVEAMDVNDFSSFLRALGQCPTEAEIIQMLRDIDALEADTLTFDQVVRIMKIHFQTPHTEEDLTKAFQVFDRTGDGTLGTQEIMFVINNLGEVYQEDEIREMFLEIDKDRDGRIKVDDFIALMGDPNVRSRRKTKCKK